MSQKIRILISDNCKDLVWLLVQYLSGEPDIEIIGVAYDGKQTVEMVRQTNPDVLLLDIVMPEMDGIETLRRIRKDNKKLKVFIMSAIDVSHIINNIDELGIRQYFLKPLDLNNLMKAIRGCRVCR